MLGYCQAIVSGQQYGRELVGGHRCPRLAKRTVGEVVLCKQHAAIAERGGSINVRV